MSEPKFWPCEHITLKNNKWCMERPQAYYFITPDRKKNNGTWDIVWAVGSIKELKSLGTGPENV